MGFNSAFKGIRSIWGGRLQDFRIFKGYVIRETLLNTDLDYVKCPQCNKIGNSLITQHRGASLCNGCCHGNAKMCSVYCWTTSVTVKNTKMFKVCHRKQQRLLCVHLRHLPPPKTYNCWVLPCKPNSENPSHCCLITKCFVLLPKISLHWGVSRKVPEIPILAKFEFPLQILIKYSNVKFHRNLSFGSRVDKNVDGRTDWQTCRS